MEHAHAEFLDEKLKNDQFGFACLHYSVSEASGHISILVLNKKAEAGSVRVQTQDAEATAGEDYEAVDKLIEFKKGEKEHVFDIKINDDEDWEPDENFFIHLLDPKTAAKLEGQDTTCKVTIIDDDKPGQVGFEETNTVTANANEEFVEIVLVRKNGSDGTITVDFETI